MDTLSGYLDNMFAALPQSAQMHKLKQDLLATMEEKYRELKEGGKSENEAIGIVISEFGNIDELMAELDLTPVGTGREDAVPRIDDEEVYGYMAAKKNAGFLVGIGVLLCILGPAALIMFSTMAETGVLGPVLRSNDAGSMLGVAVLFLLLVPAIGLFIFTGMKMQRYEYIRSGAEMSPFMKNEVIMLENRFSATYTLSIIAGVCLCVLSPVILFIASAFGDRASDYAVSAMLAVIGMAVLLFVYTGNIRESYSVLLRKGDYAPRQQEENRVIGTVAAVVWPIAVCLFLVSGFVANRWDINWIIFPITGVLFGAFCAAYSTWKGGDRQA